MDQHSRNDDVCASRLRARLRRLGIMSAGALALTGTAGIAVMMLASPGVGPVLLNVEPIHRTADSHLAQPINRHSDPLGLADMPRPTEQSSERHASVEVVDVVEHHPAEVAQNASDVRFFNGRPIRPVKTIKMVVTAYSPDERSCGKWADGITASGYSVWTNGMKLVAADTSVLPFGSLISIPGYDNENVVPVLDRGGAIKGNRLDVLYPTHEIARQWGVQELEVTVWDYADGAPNGFRTNHRRR